MIRQLFEVLSTLLLPSTWRDPYKHLPIADASRFIVTEGEAPVKLPPDHFGD